MTYALLAENAQEVAVSVRVGIFTRTEDIKFFDAWALSGTKATRC